MIDEPLVIPFSPGAALARLAQIEGVLARRPDIARAFATDSTKIASRGVSKSSAGTESSELALSLQEARHNLVQALGVENRVTVEATFAVAQNRLLRCYEAACEPGRWNDAETQAQALSALGFPDPQRRRDLLVDPVAVESVLTTYFKPQRQVLTTLAFTDAAGATAYWLSEIRVVRGEDYEDHLVENFAPVFARVRLPIGKHRLRIESRNPHARAVSPEFTIDVPDL